MNFIFAKVSLKAFSILSKTSFEIPNQGPFAAYFVKSVAELLRYDNSTYLISVWQQRAMAVYEIKEEIMKIINEPTTYQIIETFGKPVLIG